MSRPFCPSFGIRPPPGDLATPRNLDVETIRQPTDRVAGASRRDAAGMPSAPGCSRAPPSTRPPAPPPMARHPDARYEQLRVERRDAGVVLVVLDNPDRRNAMSSEMTHSWADAMTTLSKEAAGGCVVVTGAGSAFCAGGDMDWLAATPDASVDDLRA